MAGGGFKGTGNEVEELYIVGDGPLQSGESRERDLADGTEFKWCNQCNTWGNHCRSGNKAEGDNNENVDDGADRLDG